MAKDLWRRIDKKHYKQIDTLSLYCNVFKDDIFETFYFDICVLALASNGHLFYIPSPTNSPYVHNLQHLFPHHIPHTQMGFIFFLGIFRLEYGYFPWISGSTQTHVELAVAKHILLQVNANSRKSLALRPICSHTTTNPNWKLPENVKIDNSLEISLKRQHFCSNTIIPSLKFKWDVFILRMK